MISLELEPSKVSLKGDRIEIHEDHILSQPNNNHNHKTKTAITVVGLRQNNRLEPPPTQTKNYKIEQNLSKTQKTKVISLYKETQKQFLKSMPTLKMAH